MLAPSKQTSHKVFTPFEPLSPVKIVRDLLMDELERKKLALATTSAPNKENAPLTSPNTSLPMQVALVQLKGTSSSYLFSQSPIKSTLPLPSIPTIEFSPIKPSRLKPTLKQRYTQEEVDELITEKEAEAKFWKGTAMQQQAVLVMQGLYTRRVRKQLQAKESKASKKTNLKLTQDGLGHVLTMPGLMEETAAVEEAQEQAAQEKEERRLSWGVAVAKWTEARAVVKVAGHKLKDWDAKNPKPKQKSPEFCDIPKIPKPKVASTQVEDDKDQGIQLNGKWGLWYKGKMRAMSDGSPRPPCWDTSVRTGATMHVLDDWHGMAMIGKSYSLTSRQECNHRATVRPFGRALAGAPTKFTITVIRPIPGPLISFTMYGLLLFSRTQMYYNNMKQ
ncbi:hypothetical protein FA15DRAFT_739702 [Coprinopsis marcescibilis]|uniref:Uncharacterized protein n=1 Tax=Coprinopsis marcescibilis TaxID=230819 RepID=A0A5C3KAP8_COPMA|nr:hypothetical protein FA15DRAFT_739702 [Coprinopsis marcescibilis]